MQMREQKFSAQGKEDLSVYLNRQRTGPLCRILIVGRVQVLVKPCLRFLDQEALDCKSFRAALCNIVA